MSNNNESKAYNPTLTDVNRARERQTVIDPNKGPKNKEPEKITRKKVD